jgi:hypothetical protein
MTKMLTIRVHVGIMLTAGLLTVGCQSNAEAVPETRLTPAPPAALGVLREDRLDCFHPDSTGSAEAALLYSDLSVSDVTYDASGTVFAFYRSATGWTGTIRQAEGELGDPEPLLSLALHPDSGTVRLSYSHGDSAGTVGYFAGKISCDSIYGDWTPYPGVTKKKGYRRVLRPDDVPPAEDI